MYVAARKRFYQNVSVMRGNGDFEVCLDQRRLKTPLGNEFKVPNETLAHAVAQEWAAQEELIITQQMHLTGLCNVCVDNPMDIQEDALADAILNFLVTDTVLFFSTVRWPF